MHLRIIQVYYGHIIMVFMFPPFSLALKSPEEGKLCFISILVVMPLIKWEPAGTGGKRLEP